MTGLDGYLYMSSTSESSGRINITLTFAAGTDPDMAPGASWCSGPSVSGTVFPAGSGSAFRRDGY